MKHLLQAVATVIGLHVNRPLVRALPLGLLLFLARVLAVPLAAISSVAWRLRAAGLLRLDRQFLCVGYLHGVGTLEKQIIRHKFEQLPDVPRMVPVAGLQYLLESRRSGRGLILASVHSPVFRLLQHWINQFERGWHPYLVRRFCEIPAGAPGQRLRLIQAQQERIFGGRLIAVGHGIRQAIRVLRGSGSRCRAGDPALRCPPPLPGAPAQVQASCPSAFPV